MPRPCIVCSSELRPEIDKMLLRGDTKSEITKFANDRGLEVSGASINRHALRHLKGYTARKTSEIVDVSDLASDDLVIKPLQDMSVDTSLEGDEDPENLDPEKYRTVILGALRTLTVSVTLGAVTKNKRHQEGQGRFPIEDFSAIEKLLKLQDLITSRAVKSGTEGYDVFAVDTELERRQAEQESLRPKIREKDPEDDEISTIEKAIWSLTFQERTPLILEQKRRLEKRKTELIYRKTSRLMDKVDISDAS